MIDMIFTMHQLGSLGFLKKIQVNPFFESTPCRSIEPTTEVPAESMPPEEMEGCGGIQPWDRSFRIFMDDFGKLFFYTISHKQLSRLTILLFHIGDITGRAIWMIELKEHTHMFMHGRRKIV